MNEEQVSDSDFEDYYQYMVTLIDGYNCSLNAIIVEDEVVYAVEDDGDIEEYENYVKALEEYSKIAYKKNKDKNTLS